MKENIPIMNPKEIVKETYKNAGGIFEMKSSGEVCRDRTQIYNMKQYHQGSTSGLTTNCGKDLVYDLLEQQYCSEHEFVCNVAFDDSVMAVVGLDQQYNDIQRFCASHATSGAGVLGIDPTFNLGDFYVTPTVFEHKLLKNKKTGKHPNLMGPVLIHQNRKRDTYYYFASELKKMRQRLDSLLAFGTDGEEALHSAFSSVFPHAIHLQCELHKRDNITRKLQSLKLDGSFVKTIVNDIFGSGNCDGLIDSKDVSTFSNNLEALKAKWDSICPLFHEWFCKNEAEIFCTSMISSVRSAGGLGKPPKRYTTNSNESLNNLLKKKTDYKKSEWPKFNHLLRSSCEEQEEEVNKAVFGIGEYEIIEEYKHLEIPQASWTRMTPEQRKQHVKRFSKATLDCNIQNTSLEEADKNHHNVRLSISWLDASISHVHSEMLERMWEKAEILLSTPGFVLATAGNNELSRQVASLSDQKNKFVPPHYVCAEQRKVGMEVKCDCPVYKSTPCICQHTLAAAQDMMILPQYITSGTKDKEVAKFVTTDS